MPFEISNPQALRAGLAPLGPSASSGPGTRVHLACRPLHVLTPLPVTLIPSSSPGGPCSTSGSAYKALLQEATLVPGHLRQLRSKAEYCKLSKFSRCGPKVQREFAPQPSRGLWL